MSFGKLTNRVKERVPKIRNHAYEALLSLLLEVKQGVIIKERIPALV